MTNYVPWMVLTAGLVATVYYGVTKTIPQIESKLDQSIDAALPKGTRHGATIAVSGRDIMVSGLFHDENEKNAVLSALGAIEGPRTILTEDISFLPVAKPYTGKVTKGETGIRVQTVMPDEALAQVIGRSFQGNAELEYTLSSGMPDENWPSQLVAMTSVLSNVETGSASLEGTTIFLSGKANNRSDKDRFAAFSKALPDGYSVDLTGIEYPEPYSIILDKAATGTVQIQGLAPEDINVSRVASMLDLEDIEMGALHNIADGDASEIEAKLQEIAPVLALMKSYKVSFNQIPENALEVTGVVLPNADLDEFAKARQAANLNNADLQMPQPFDVQFSLDAVKGAQLIGLAPEGFDAKALADNLGIPSINTDQFEIGARGNSDELSDQISGLKPVLEDVETLEVGLEGLEGSTPEVKAETLPNADPERVANLLKDVFVTLTEVDVAPTKNVYENGQTRINGITGVKEQYQSGFWVPLITVTDASPEGCKAITDAILLDRQIVFKSALAKLDPSARVVINKLAGVVSSCFAQTELKVELSGHTDSDGDETTNRFLSIERVNTVRDALVIRGVDILRILAVGYGETRPIADNATPEGRTANRRTEFDWLN